MLDLTLCNFKKVMKQSTMHPYGTIPPSTMKTPFKIISEANTHSLL